MWNLIKRLLQITDKGVDRVGYWWPILVWLATLFGGGAVIMSWIGSQWQALAVHGWAVVVLFGIAAASLLTLVLSIALVSWRYFHPLGNNPVGAEAKAQHEEKRIFSADPQAEALDKTAYNEILAFCLDTLLPACAGIADLQELIIREKCHDEEMADLALSGLRSEWSFYENYYGLSDGLTSSPGPDITFDSMLNYIDELEKGAYRNNYVQFIKMISTIETEQCDQNAIRDAWERFRESHNQLVDEYNKIKRDVRFGKLLRPARESRWGPTINAIPRYEGIPFLSLLGTEGKIHP